MFTGIVEGLATITGVRPSNLGTHLTVQADFVLSGTRIGDSIAVSGACLTVVAIAGQRFEVDVAPETLLKTTLGQVKTGERVNLERALRLSDRLDGHLVSGHVDGVGVIQQKQRTGNAIIVNVRVAQALTRYMVEKGSVAVDGISLTINTVGSEFFAVSIIPHTASLTTIGFKPVGARVNIETDLIGKYVERFVLKNKEDNGAASQGKASLDLQQMLQRSGFI
jgi:riboflavin synthase